jgi:enamine deaminase RidA (YjgF/YER057c/UK114 family)
MTERRLVSSGSPWEPVVGYSRAVRDGDRVWVAGTTATNPDGTIHAPGDAYAQALYCFIIIERALIEAGSSMDDVVRTRMFVTDISRWQEYGRAHGEYFAKVRPAATMVEVSRLIDPGHLVEIEVDAVVRGL